MTPITTPSLVRLILPCALAIGGLAVGLRLAPPRPFVVYVAPPAHVLDFQVCRCQLERWLHASSAITRSVRIVPTVTDGRPRGFRLYAIRPGSVPWQLGLRNGDRIISVNGRRLQSPDACLETYARLRCSNEIEVVLERLGIEHRLHYHIR